MPLRLRTAVLLLALAALLGVQAATATPEHLHLNSSPNRCDLCFTAHVSAVQTPTAQLVPVIEVQGLAVLLLPYFGYRCFDGQPSFSRGPPSLDL